MTLCFILISPPPHLTFSLPTLLPHEPRIQCCTALGCLKVSIHSALDATGEYEHSLWWMLLEELATSFAFETTT